jgi:hypothetical protein
MGSNVEIQTVAEEYPNAAKSVNGETTDVRIPKRVVEAFMDGCVLLLKPDWELIGENTSINEYCQIDETQAQDQC